MTDDPLARPSFMRRREFPEVPTRPLRDARSSDVDLDVDLADLPPAEARPGAWYEETSAWGRADDEAVAAAEAEAAAEPGAAGDADLYDGNHDDGNHDDGALDDGDGDGDRHQGGDDEGACPTTTSPRWR